MIQDIYAIDPKPEEFIIAGLNKPKTTLGFYYNERLLMKMFYGNSFATREQNTYIKTNQSPIIYITDSLINQSINNVLENVFGEWFCVHE